MSTADAKNNNHSSEEEEQILVILKQIFSRKWLLTTILVVAAVGVMVRLGFWQLDRLEQRRTFNARVTEQIEKPTLELTDKSINLDLSQMEYRNVVVTGEYDFTNEVASNNQVYNSFYGINLLTPLKISGTNTFVLVDRGWVPIEDYSPDSWGKYAEPGLISVEGVIRRTQSKPDLGGIPDPTLTPEQTRLIHWKVINLERIQLESGLPMLDVYIQQTPEGERSNPPFRAVLELELTERSHLGYALQWFAFAVTLAFGYPFYLRSQINEKSEDGNTDKVKL